MLGTTVLWRIPIQRRSWHPEWNAKWEESAFGFGLTLKGSFEKRVLHYGVNFPNMLRKMVQHSLLAARAAYYSENLLDHIFDLIG